MAVQQIMNMRPPNSAGGEKLQHEDLAMKWALWAGVGYLCLFGIFGFIAALKFVVPDLFYGVNWLSWPRIRPAHVQGMIFGWLLPIYMCLFYYIVPRLCGTKLFSEKLGIATTIVWSAGVLWATFWLIDPTDTLSLPLMTKGKEYEEYDMIANVALLTAWIMLLVNMLTTFARRTYKQMYVALWYIMGCLMWTAFVYILGNWPSQLLHEDGFKGLNDANINWFYGHSVVGLIATPGGLGIAIISCPRLPIVRFTAISCR